MKTLTYTTAIFVAMAATSVFAHHPSEGVSPNYDVVDEQLADTPHDEMLEADMGSTEAAGMAEIDPTQSGFTSVQTQDGAMSEDGAMVGDVPLQDGDGPGMDAAAEVGTIDLMENVAQ